MNYIVNTLNIAFALLCFGALAGVWYSKRDYGGTWDCPIENSLAGVVTGAGVLSIINCFI